MISEVQLRELLAQKSESKNLDYKKSLNWNKAGNDEKCELIKDILSMMNTQDGGRVVFGVENDTFEPVGLSEEDFISFDTTKVNDFLQRYTDPQASCEVQKISVDGRKLAVISAPEFRDIPIVCKRDANSSSNSSKLILKAGGLYVRTEKATSELVSSAESMRDLMNRALLKRGDQLLNTIGALFKGNPVSSEQELSRYEKEMESARGYFKEVLPGEVDRDGYWELKAMPMVYLADRMPDTATVTRHLFEAQVVLRGWDFPHIDKDTMSNFANGRQSHTNFVFSFRHLEAHRAYRSGLFVWRAAFWEDGPEFSEGHRRGEGKVLSFVNVIYTVTEMFVFLKRYYSQVAEDGEVHVSLEMKGIKKRRFIALGDAMPWHGNCVSSEAEWTTEADYSVSELRASAEEIAIGFIRKIFEVFNWNNPDPNWIRMWQQKLLSRTL